MTTARTEPPESAPVRASDAEREATGAALHRALGEGRPDLDETEARVSATYAATYRGELSPLLADLPEPSPAAEGGAASWTELWIALVWRARGLLLGPAAAAGQRPTPGERRVAAWLVVLAVAWTVLCALAAAAVVA